MSATLNARSREMSEPAVVQQIAEAIRANHHIIILGHAHPDGDCMGAGVGLCILLKNMGKRVRFITTGPIPHYFFTYLPGVDEVDLQLPKDQPELFIHVDCGDPERVDDDFKAQGLTVNIDHHLSNTEYATLNWVDTSAASAAEMIWRLAAAMDLPITPDAATALYTGVMTDTGGFRYTNTDALTLRIAGDLVERGANPALIAGSVYESRKPQSVRLIGEVYASLKYEFDGRLVWNEITQALYGTVGGDEFEPDGLASDIRGIDGVEVSALFHETVEGNCRVGLRSKGKVNVSALAQTLGGGGHHNASGAYMRGEYTERREWALGVIREYLAKHL